MQQVIEHHDRVLLDLTQSGLEAELPKLLLACEEVWWLVEPRFEATSCGNLRKLLAVEPQLAGRVRLVWILDQGERFAPPLQGMALNTPNFKIVLDEPHRAAGRQQQHGIERLVRHLQGRQIGLALGGGGAWACASRRAAPLERAGISFDLVAGTSSGASDWSGVRRRLVASGGRRRIQSSARLHRAGCKPYRAGSDSTCGRCSEPGHGTTSCVTFSAT